MKSMGRRIFVSLLMLKPIILFLNLSVILLVSFMWAAGLEIGNG